MTEESSGEGFKDWLKKPKNWRLTIAVIIAIFFFLAVIAYPAWQFYRGYKDFLENLVSGLFIVVVALSILVILIPTGMKFIREDILGEEDQKPEKWMTRLRTVVTVALTLVLLVFVLTWIKSPETLEVQQPSAVTPNGTSNDTGNVTQTWKVELHPFVQSFFGVYAVVIAFYFTVSGAQSIADKVLEWKKLSQPTEQKPKT
ncbi:MAG: hypothetical protein E3J35_04275 [Methanomassiliicoccales archaeon]|nr:MAG: hypothetical protein E3J35_04275 [Methanomassiliicoccales archaeon]